MNATDKKYLKQAINVAVENVLNSGGPFGAVIVTEDGRVFKAGNSVTNTNDPTAHAEVNVIREACAQLGTFDLSGAIIYSSCEPCPMCLGACLWARLDRIVYAADRYDAAKAGFDDAEFYNLLEQGKVASEMKISEYNQPFDTWTAKVDKVDY